MKIEWEDGSYIEIQETPTGVNIILAAKETDKKKTVNSVSITKEELKTLMQNIKY